MNFRLYRGLLRVLMQSGVIEDINLLNLTEFSRRIEKIFHSRGPLFAIWYLKTTRVVLYRYISHKQRLKSPGIAVTRDGIP
jgi:hypothetical protein